MVRTRFGIVLFCLFVLAAAIVPISTQPAAASDTGGTCSTLAQTALSAVKQSCGTAVANTVCLGYDAIKATFSGSANPTFKTKGDQVNLADIASLTTSVANPEAGNWGVGLLNIQADLPASSKGITGVLFGDATLTSNVRTGATELPTLPVTNPGEMVLLRGGVGPNYPASLKLLPRQNAVVDGRNKTGDWLRVRLDSAVGWAFASQVKVTGDISTLTVLDDLDTRADFLYKNPMQALTLSTGAVATCSGMAPSGLLLQLTGDQTAHLLVNGADLALSASTLYLRATPKDRLEIAVITGTAQVTAQGSTLALNAGQWTRIRLGGKDGLTVAAAPGAKAAYPFATIDGAPVTLLASDVPCTIGLPADSKSRVTVRVGPGDERGSLFFMKPESSFAVKGQAEDSKGAPWWKIDADGRDQAWVAQSLVHTLGKCDQIAKADIPQVIAAAPPANTGDNNTTSSGDSGAQGFAPTNASIYNVIPGLDKLVGDCPAGVEPINYCPSLVKLTPQGNGFQWKGQELTPYFMNRVRENVYYYAGAAPEALGPGTIKLTLVFTSESTWTTTRILTLRAAPACQHVYSFSGTFLR